jgi:hypothetical protein
MLNEQIFRQHLIDFLGFYGRTINCHLLYRSWYNCLSENFCDAELEAAFELAFRKFEFAPSPEKFIEAVKGSQEVLAYEEWNKCTHAAAQNDQEDLLLSAHAEKALQAIGGIKRLKEAEPEKTHGLLAKDFVRLWLQYKNAIASGLVEAPKPLLKAVPDLPKPEEPPATPEQWQEFKSRLNDLFKKEG